MSMATYLVKIPPGARLAGRTATGQRAVIAPGEHHVHRLRLRAKPPRWAAREVLRFVGADFRGRDVHVPIPPGADIRDVLALDLVPVKSAQRDA
jgi:hypothetical protein